MRFTPTEIPEVILIEPDVYGDERGFFLETYNSAKYASAGVTAHFIQDNHSKSRQGTLRGLHGQLRHAQAKLIRVIAGDILDVAVDARPASPHFGRWVSARLSADNFQQIFIPRGFLHGFLVLSDMAEVEYKCDNLYDPDSEISVRWNDPDLAIDWPETAPILSARDQTARSFAETGELLKKAYPYGSPMA